MTPERFREGYDPPPAYPDHVDWPADDDDGEHDDFEQVWQEAAFDSVDDDQEDDER